MIISRRRFEAEKQAAIDKACQDIWREQDRQRELEYIHRDIYRLMERLDKLEKEVFGLEPDKNLVPVNKPL